MVRVCIIILFVNSTTEKMWLSLQFAVEKKYTQYISVSIVGQMGCKISDIEKNSNIVDPYSEHFSLHRAFLQRRVSELGGGFVDVIIVSCSGITVSVVLNESVTIIIRKSNHYTETHYPLYWDITGFFLITISVNVSEPGRLHTCNIWFSGCCFPMLDWN